ncbi:putative extracellular dioxygenase protein [Botrytis fragariae]|uniref:Putative extracellular dioxygenase protein n=1 Tax=Botrytis fragariae TaxID=1964551 RepID=A0A8H6EJ11_9HELO|nr:putative extracellular dioxygenase protein [Botrytis fragariae]KAF5874023.1 putative extracellular dioxygenase protein [Botrytis fragariae]
MVYHTSNLKSFWSFVTFASLFQGVFTHTGHNIREEIAQRDAFFGNSKRDVSHCFERMKKRGLGSQYHERLAKALTKARSNFGLSQKGNSLKDRDTSPLTTSHLSSLDVTPSTADVEAIVFSNSSCVLQAEGEVGRFYVSGEYIRSDVRESEEGVPVVIDAEFLDINTCIGISDLYWDIWNANSTNTTNIDKTFLRGLQPTDDEGVAQFTTLFPGHYTGRTNHIHVVAHVGGSILPNGTYTGGNVTHIGQLLSDQSLITQVEAVSPYSTNTQEVTLNANDRFLLNEINGGGDAIADYVLLGDTIDEGVFAWITVGVNLEASYNANAVAELTAAGGVLLASSGSGGGGGGSLPS